MFCGLEARAVVEYHSNKILSFMWGKSFGSEDLWTSLVSERERHIIKILQPSRFILFSLFQCCTFPIDNLQPANSRPILFYRLINDWVLGSKYKLFVSRLLRHMHHKYTTRIYVLKHGRVMFSSYLCCVFPIARYINRRLEPAWCANQPCMAVCGWWGVGEICDK